MTKLSVNINKIATIRNSRGGNNPNVLKVALDCIAFGADGITVHPRPDERHIRYADVYAIKEVIDKELNVEGYPSPEFMKLVLEVCPAQVTLVPDAPDAITSNAGWNIVAHFDFLKSVVSTLKNAGIRASVFIDPKPEMVHKAVEIGADRVEFYTEPYAVDYLLDPAKAVAPYVEASKVAIEWGLGINAGHDLDLNNLGYLYQNITALDEVSIGHALVCDALYIGLEETIKRYQKCLNKIV